MTLNGWIQIALYGAIVLALVKPLGSYMTRVFTGERTFLSPVLGPIERGLYRVSGIDDRQEQHWLAYTGAVILFLVFWEVSVLAGWANPLFTSSPSRIFAAGFEMFADGSIFPDLAVSGEEFALGIVLVRGGHAEGAAVGAGTRG